VTRLPGPGLSATDLQTLQVLDRTGKVLSQTTLPLDPDVAGEQPTVRQTYTGPVYRGINYSPSWAGFIPGQGNTQQQDSDFATDAFQSFWANKRYPLQPDDTGSQLPGDPMNGPNPMLPANTLFRDDLGLIKADGFNLVRLYNWNPTRDW